MLKELWLALGGDDADLGKLTISGSGALESAFPVTDLAASSVAVAALSISELLEHTIRIAPEINVDRRLASFWFQSSIRPMNWAVPAPWDAIAGDYLASDGWIRLHTNAPHHRKAVEKVLGVNGGKEIVAEAVERWTKQDLEMAVVAAGGCAAEMRTIDEWKQHPQGIALAMEKLVDISEVGRCSAGNWIPKAERPLAGIKVLDLTRVLAGPVATRFLAGYGAEVLRVDPPDWDEPGVVPDVTLGKKCARLDLRKLEDRTTFEVVLSQADVILHGYRPGALDGLGYDADTRRNIAPNIIDVTLCAYGWTGPLAARRGFDSLVQMSTGIADAGMKWKGSAKPVPLPAQALDHSTGYLLAATTIRALTARLVRGVGTNARLSLARTANELISRQSEAEVLALNPENAEDLSPTIEETTWGKARRLKPPVRIEGAPMYWDFPACNLGSSLPSWQ